MYVCVCMACGNETGEISILTYKLYEKHEGVSFLLTSDYCRR